MSLLKKIGKNNKQAVDYILSTAFDFKKTFAIKFQNWLNIYWYMTIILVVTKNQIKGEQDDRTFFFILQAS